MGTDPGAQEHPDREALDWYREVRGPRPGGVDPASHFEQSGDEVAGLDRRPERFDEGGGEQPVHGKRWIVDRDRLHRQGERGLQGVKGTAAVSEHPG